MIWVLILILYTILIFSLAFGITKVDEFICEKTSPKSKFSILIPYRNEAENLPKLLQSISKIKYPKELFEFIFINDDSSDNSSTIIKEKLNSTLFNYSIINNKRTSNSPKKDAITTAIIIAKNNWIITTDADCILPKTWLSTLDNFIQKNNPNMVVSPVNYIAKENYLEQFQLLDFLSLQGATIGGFGVNFPFLCNGANLAYKKETFNTLKGFEGNNSIASGDDIFLFEKFLNSNKESVLYLKSKDVIVNTYPVKTWKELINQRTRWAAKTSIIKSFNVKMIGFIILATHMLVISYLFMGSLKTMFIPLTIKIIVDWFLFKLTTRFFNIKIKFLKWYFLSSLLYPFFSIYIFLNSLFFKYEWKERQFKK